MNSPKHENLNEKRPDILKQIIAGLVEKLAQEIDKQLLESMKGQK